jgi:LMBR1 domain-containing protein 1
MEILAVGLAIFAGLLLVVGVFNYSFVKHYADPSENYALATWVVVGSLSATLMTVLLVPLDILVTTDAIPGIEIIGGESFRSVLFGAFGLMICFAFVILPFAYFYGEERGDEIDGEDGNVCEKTCESCKYTAITVLVCVGLAIIGLVCRPTKEDWGQGKEWVKKLFDVDNAGEAAISFIVAGLTMVGGGLWSIYTSFGMASLPILLIKGRKSLQETQNEIKNDLNNIKEQIRDIELRAVKTKKTLTKNEKKTKAALEKKQQKMINKSEKIQAKQKESSLILSTIFDLLTPFRMMIGICCLLLSFLYVISLGLGCINRLLNSECGFSCGFIITGNKSFNPFDVVLANSSFYFPMDYLLFGVVSIYAFITSLYGIIDKGIMLLCIPVIPIQIFAIKPKKTMPQALLLLSITMMMILLGIFLATLTIAPIYSTFGYQTFTENDAELLCTLENHSEDACQMSNISQLYNK